MTTIDIYFGVAAAAILIIGAITMIVLARRRKDVPLDMPKNEGDPLFDKTESPAPNSDLLVGRWGDQVIGKPKVIATESPEERAARIHHESEQLQMQQQLSQMRQPTAYTPRTVYAHIDTHQTAKEQIQKNVMVVLYVMAAEHHRFSGYELYQSLINAGLIYGKMRIFHYHERHDNQRPVLFSVASAINPGSIDIDHIGSFSTPGLTLFLDTNRTSNPKAALETMIAVAEQLADDLNGVVLNSQRQKWSTDIESECYAQL